MNDQTEHWNFKWNLFQFCLSKCLHNISWKFIFYDFALIHYPSQSHLFFVGGDSLIHSHSFRHWSISSEGAWFSMPLTLPPSTAYSTYSSPNHCAPISDWQSWGRPFCRARMSWTNGRGSWRCQLRNSWSYSTCFACESSARAPGRLRRLEGVCALSGRCRHRRIRGTSTSKLGWVRSRGWRGRGGAFCLEHLARPKVVKTHKQHGWLLFIKAPKMWITRVFVSNHMASYNLYRNTYTKSIFHF